MQLPNQLKKLLVQDWEAVSRENRLVQLPASPTVAEVLSGFVSAQMQRKSCTAASQRVFQLVCDGLRGYFDRGLGAILLYRQERAQYESYCSAHPGVRPSDVYGAEHFLRLFIRLPDLMAHTNVNDADAAELTKRLNELLRHMCKSADKLFCARYQSPPGRQPISLQGIVAAASTSASAAAGHKPG